jgi:hypothetical protein
MSLQLNLGFAENLNTSTADKLQITLNPIQLQISESINNWQDNFRTFWFPISDNLNNWQDHFNYFIPQISDNLNNWQDAAFVFIPTTQQLTLTLSDNLHSFIQDAVKLYIDPTPLALSDDNSGNWQDHIQNSFNPERTFTDNLNVMADAVAKALLTSLGFQDDNSGNWQDAFLTNFAPSEVVADSINLMADNININIKNGFGIAETLSFSDQFNYFIPQKSDSLQLTDSVAIKFIGLMTLAVSDAFAGMTDSISSLRTGGAALFLTISDTIFLNDALVSNFTGNAAPPNTSTGSPGNISISADGGVVGILDINSQSKQLYSTLYRYANLDLPFSPNDPGLAYTYDNTVLQQISVPLAARFFNLLDEVSDPLFFDVGSPTASGGIVECIDVRSTGAIGDGVTNDTAAIMRALDEAHQNYLNGLLGNPTGPTKVCIVAGLICMVGGGFWDTPAGEAWPQNPAHGIGAAFPQAGAASNSSLTAFSTFPIDAALYVKSGVTVQLDGMVRLFSSAQFPNATPESTVFAFYDNGAPLGLVGPADCSAQNAQIVGTGSIDGQMQTWVPSDGFGTGIYVNVGAGSNFICNGITVRNCFNMGIYVDGNINDSTVFSSAQVTDCTIDTFGLPSVSAGGFVNGGMCLAGIGVWANGVQVSRNRILNGFGVNIIATFTRGIYMSGQQITVSNNLINNCTCGIFVGSGQKLGNQVPPCGGIYLSKINGNTMQGPGLQLAADGFPDTNPNDMSGLIGGIDVACAIGDRNSSNGILNYVNGLDIGDNTIAQFFNGIQTTLFNFAGDVGGLWNVNIHDNNCNNNYGYGIVLTTPQGGLHNVNVWGNMTQDDVLGGFNVDGNVDASAIGTPTPGLSGGTSPGAPGIINTGGTVLSGDPGIYELYYYFESNPDNAEQVIRMTMTRRITFPANFAGSVGNAKTTPLATVAYSIVELNNIANILGTITIATNGVFTFASQGGAPVVYQPGQVLVVIAPSPNDLNLAGVEFTLVGSRL